MLSQATTKLFEAFERVLRMILHDYEKDIDQSKVVRRIIKFCCIFEIGFLIVNAVMGASIQLLIAHGLQSLLSGFVLYLLRPSRSPRALGLFYLSASTILCMMSFGFSDMKITYFFQWFVPIYVFALFVAGSVYFLVFSVLYVTASLILLATQGDLLISQEIANYSDRSFWFMMLNDTAAQLLSIAMLVFFENFREKTEWIANSKQVESVKISHRLAYADMVGHLAHEVNNPLAIIEAASIKMKRISDRDVPDIVAARLQLSGYIGDSIARLDEVQHSLLIFARGSDREAKRSVTMRMFLHSMADRFGRLCRDRAIELQLSDFTDHRPFLIRFQSLAFAIEKLVQNSIEALMNRKEGRSIFIEASNTDERLRIVVRDNGEGVAAGDEFRIFDPFYSHKAMPSFKGLGLSMARGILEMDNGEIYLDRSYKDTCFVLTLPIP